MVVAFVSRRGGRYYGQEPRSQGAAVLGVAQPDLPDLVMQHRGAVRLPDDGDAGLGERHSAYAVAEVAAGGDFEALLRVLDPNVKLTVDTPTGVVVTLGATEVAAGTRMFSGEVARQRPVLVNGVPGHRSRRSDGTPLSVIAFTVADSRISGIHIVVNPVKLASIQLPAPA